MRNPHHVLLAALLGLALSTGVASAQPPDKGGEVRILPLKHAKAADTLQVLRELLGPRASKQGTIGLGIDERTNTLIISASQLDAQSIERVVGALDAPAPEVQQQQEFQIIRLSRAAADKQLERMLQMIIGERTGVRIAVDPASNVVLVRGTKEAIEAVRRAVVRLDEERVDAAPVSRGLQIRVVWLVAEKHKDAGMPADSFQELTGELAKLGLQRFRIAAQTMVYAQAGAPFEMRIELINQYFNYILLILTDNFNKS